MTSEMPSYFKKLLPEDYLTYHELTHWKFGPPIQRPHPDNRIGIGDLVRLSPMCPTEGFPEHTVDHFQLLYVYSGTMLIRFQGDLPCTLSSGDAILLSPQASRSVAPCGRGDYGILISMKPQLLKEHLPLQDLPAFSDYLNLGSEFSYMPTEPFLLFHADSEAQRYINELCSEHFEPDRRTYLVFPALLSMVMIALDRCMDVTSGVRGTATPQTIDAVLRYMKSNYATAMLEPTARRFGFSPNYLSHMLRQATGYSFQALKQNESISQGARLLRDTDLTVAQISRMVGMGNLTRFYKAFTDRYGVTPAQYRSQN